MIGAGDASAFLSLLFGNDSASKSGGGNACCGSQGATPEVQVAAGPLEKEVLAIAVSIILLLLLGHRLQ